MGVFAQRYSNQYLREDNAFTERVNLLTFFLMCINFTVLLTKFKLTSDLFSILMVFFLVMLFFLFKLLIIRFLGFLFKSKDLAKLTVFFSFLFDKTLGFILSPLVLVVCFFLFDITSVVLVIAFFLFLVLLAVKLFWLWKIGSGLFGISRVYIFLYLCTLEIFPLLLVARGFFY